MKKISLEKLHLELVLNEELPSDPLNWALNQLDDVTDLTWKGKIPSGKEMIKVHARKNRIELKKKI